MLSRLALRHARLALRASPQQLRPLGFHSSAATGKSESESEASDVIAVPTQGLLEQYGLTDWKISAPLIGALAIPAISNGVSGPVHVGPTA